jgi:hypothetical protein
VELVAQVDGQVARRRIAGEEGSYLPVRYEALDVLHVACEPELGTVRSLTQGYNFQQLWSST